MQQQKDQSATKGIKQHMEIPKKKKKTTIKVCVCVCLRIWLYVSPLPFCRSEIRIRVTTEDQGRVVPCEADNGLGVIAATNITLDVLRECVSPRLPHSLCLSLSYACLDRNAFGSLSLSLAHSHVVCLFCLSLSLSHIFTLVFSPLCLLSLLCFTS